MRSAPFRYERARSLSDAARAKAGGALLLAGGQSVVPAMKRRELSPTRVVDIAPLDALRGVGRSPAGTLRLGALTPFRTLCETLPELGVWAALRDAAYWVGDVQVRNRGTLGGNLCYGDPRANTPPALLALGALLHLEGGNGARRVEIDAFWLAEGMTSLAAEELVTAIELPIWPTPCGGAYREIAPQPGGVPLLNAAVVIAGDPITRARVAVGGLGPSARRLPRVEAALIGGPCNEEHFANAAAELAAESTEPAHDPRASTTYRLRVAPALVRRTLLAAASVYA